MLLQTLSLVVLVLTELNQLRWCSAVDVKMMEGGKALQVTMNLGCYEMKPNWDNRVTHVDVSLGCLKLFKEKGCAGEKLFLLQGVHELKPGWAKEISSARLCTNEEEEAETGSKLPEFSEEELRAIGVEEHNKYRQMHGVDDVKGNPEIHSDAQKWADYSGKTGKLKANTVYNKYGSNVARSLQRLKGEAVKDAVKQWYDNVQNYDFSNPQYNPGGKNTGSFIAVVWKQTTDIGVGIAWDEANHCWVVTCFYAPPPQKTGLQENVPPPKS